MASAASTEHAPSVAFEQAAAAAIASARRAVVADRYAANALTAEWRTLAELATIVAEWRDLAARALEPNVFYDPAFALEAAVAFGDGAGAVLVWSGTSPRRLLGLFPGRIESRRYGLTLPLLVGWTHPYAPLGVPLVEREAAEPVIAAWLGHLADNAELPGLVLLPYLPTDGAFAASLDVIVRRARMPQAEFNTHRRAALDPYGDRSHYVERAMSQRRRKELRRVLRRLGDMGAILFTTATEPTPVAAALGDFLTLEARGWKGQAGTAAEQHDHIRGFVQAAVNGLAAYGQVAIDRLLIDGRAIAVAITLRSGDAAWFWKLVYDEDFAAYSPGVILTVAITEELLDDVSIARADSCATADHPMIDHIWRERLSLSDRLIAVRPQAPFAYVRHLEQLRGAALAIAKRLGAYARR